MSGAVRFSVGDTLRMRKPHPCGCDLFRVLRVGTDVRIECTECSRSIILPRIKVEKSTKEVISSVDTENK